MDEPFQDLEAELKQLCPRAPSAGLLARLENELTGPDTVACAARPPRV
jgi:hypothetical protein